MSLLHNTLITAGASAMAAGIADRSPRLAALRTTDPVLYSAIIGAVAGAFMAGVQMAAADTPAAPEPQLPPSFLPGGQRLV